jgi:hypothetical protein
MHDWKKIKMNFQFCHFQKNIDKILNKKIDICATFKTKHGLNKMHPFVVS